MTDTASQSRRRCLLPSRMYGLHQRHTSRAVEPAAVEAVTAVLHQDRWDLADPKSSCDCCNAFAVDVQQIASDGVTRLLQPMGPPVPGILLMSPVRHVERLSDLEPAEFHSLMTCAFAVRRAFELTVGAPGTYVFFNDGPAAGQSTPHLHVHLHGRLRRQPLNPFKRGSRLAASGAEPASTPALKQAIGTALRGLWPAEGPG